MSGQRNKRARKNLKRLFAHLHEFLWEITIFTSVLVAVLRFLWSEIAPFFK